MLFRVLIMTALLAVVQTSIAQSLTERLGNVFGSSSASNEILNPDVAFTFESDVNNPQQINLQWRVEDGYYLYRDKFKFAINEGPATIDQNQVNIPAGKLKEDPAFGQVEINTGDFNIELRWLQARKPCVP